MFGHIVPCGIADKGVTSLAAEGVEATMREVVDALTGLAVARWAPDGRWDRADVVWRHQPGGTDLAPFSRGAGPGDPVRPTAASAVVDSSPQQIPATVSMPQAAAGTSVHARSRLAEAGVTEGLEIARRKPSWLRAPLNVTPGYTRLKRTMRDLSLATVCEEAGCPNIFECWGAGTATFMVNGERCTRACGFCLVDTRRPSLPDPAEPAKVAEAVARMGLRYAVLTTVARDDLPDGGAGHIAATIEAIRRRNPGVQIEALISDCKGDPESLQLVFDAAPDVLNHNVETVARLQRAVRPSASYARSLAVLARAKAAGFVTKSSLMVGIGEDDHEVQEALADLRGIGVDIVTIGQYLRPTTHHLPVTRWVTPEQFVRYKEVGEAMGIGHVEASPLTRSSYHAAGAAAAAGVGSASVVASAV
jgi:lipoic acid synthetase